MRESYALRVRQGREEEELVQQQEERRRGALVERRGRLRRALEGLGEEEEKVEAPLLKETECPVCLQVREGREDGSLARR